MATAGFQRAAAILDTHKKSTNHQMFLFRDMLILRGEQHLKHNNVPRQV